MYICIYVYSHVISVNVPPDGLHLREHFSLSLSLSLLSLSLSLFPLSLSLSLNCWWLNQWLILCL